MIKLDIKSELPQAAKWTNEHTKQLDTWYKDEIGNEICNKLINNKLNK